MPSSTAPYERTIEADVAACGAAVDLTTPIGTVPFDGVISAVTYVPTAVLTGAATNSRTLSLFNRGQAGAGTAKAATKAFVAGVDAPANDETAITLSVTPADLAVVAGDVLDFESLHVLTGLADPGGLVRVTISRANKE